MNKAANKRLHQPAELPQLQPEGKAEAKARGEFVTLARVVKTQGRWGEVAAEIHSDVPERFEAGMTLSALLANADHVANNGEPSGESRREVQIESLWPHKEWLVLKFAGVDSITEAEVFVKCELQVPREDRAHLQRGWNYVSDLVGCSVSDHGNEIGRVEDVQFGAGEAPLLIVTNKAGRKFDVPFADAFLESVDIGARQVSMKLPEGLLEINAPLTGEEKSEQAMQRQGSRESSTTRNSARIRRPRR